ncbi:MAG: response regulator transcription factor [Gammaproteobacteria bacterium]|nr:response regulator transcription factor [Gammaproteobacteria bacterium]
MDDKFKVAIIEDSPLLRDMLTELLEEIDDLDVAVIAEEQEDAVNALESCNVDLAIIDLELKTGNGLGVIKDLRDKPERYGHPKTVVFSNYTVSPMSRRCEELGVDRIYDKSFQLPELLDYVREEMEKAGSGH